MRKKIIVPTDFTAAADKAVDQALAIAKSSGAIVTLFHVIDDHSLPLQESADKLNARAGQILSDSGITCEVLLGQGSIFDAIPQALCEQDFDLVVIATHGLKGIRQKLLGADILKLVAKIPEPVLVVQEHSPLIESFNKVVVPVASHGCFPKAIEAGLLFASVFPAMEVHLYSIHKPGFDWPASMLNNIAEATRIFEEKGVNMIRIKEEQNDSSQGYARQTLRYARSIGADAIWMMSVASEDLYYMSKVYKEIILLNEFSLPVVCVGGECGV